MIALSCPGGLQQQLQCALKWARALPSSVHHTQLCPSSSLSRRCGWHCDKLTVRSRLSRQLLLKSFFIIKGFINVCFKHLQQANHSKTSGILLKAS